MRFRILWVGRTKERYLKEGIDRYLMLLGYMSPVSVTEIKEEKGKSREASLLTEGRRILKQTQSYILLDERGKEFTSPEFARFLEERGTVDFVLGGAYGVSGEVRERAEAVVALSKMTLTHEMARVILLEQLYRAMTILKGREYHH
ncbi:MAG: 23S rRNA (pseudouridine(1915)-N(3))-methyltransferase RlmH [Alphaproteobacteria bacterium]|uniref:Ribosomal RNA large subunit methyltransferase H n=1 Tax=Candidatus Nitrobium versatile TaxID=2884831 RepID=A0A953J451_9BACT|nr:23S rRNA (pseudouridine(1915)-N(3))-methyltransferase RlmH [Candidatus Nitrobium versatile]